MGREMAVSLDDNRTLQAIGILADVLDGLSGSGSIDTVVVAKALRQVIATKSRPAFDFASRSFEGLDGAVKAQVARDAEVAAKDAAELRGRVTGFLSKPPRRPPAGQSQVSGLLSAVNTRRKPTKGKPDA